MADPNFWDALRMRIAPFSDPEMQVALRMRIAPFSDPDMQAAVRKQIAPLAGTAFGTALRQSLAAFEDPALIAKVQEEIGPDAGAHACDMRRPHRAAPACRRAQSYGLDPCHRRELGAEVLIRIARPLLDAADRKQHLERGGTHDELVVRNVFRCVDDHLSVLGCTCLNTPSGDADVLRHDLDTNAVAVSGHSADHCRP